MPCTTSGQGTFGVAGVARVLAHSTNFDLVVSNTLVHVSGNVAANLPLFLTLCFGVPRQGNGEKKSCMESL